MASFGNLMSGFWGAGSAGLAGPIGVCATGIGASFGEGVCRSDFSVACPVESASPGFLATILSTLPPRTGIFLGAPPAGAKWSSRRTAAAPPAAAIRPAIEPVPGGRPPTGRVNFVASMCALTVAASSSVKLASADPFPVIPICVQISTRALFSIFSSLARV
jgi:hypothetical protein